MCYLIYCMCTQGIVVAMWPNNAIWHMKLRQFSQVLGLVNRSNSIYQYHVHFPHYTKIYQWQRARLITPLPSECVREWLGLTAFLRHQAPLQKHTGVAAALHLAVNIHSHGISRSCKMKDQALSNRSRTDETRYNINCCHGGCSDDFRGPSH